MPYIVTTTGPPTSHPGETVAIRAGAVTRHAVATLDEAREAAENAVIGAGRFDGDAPFLAAVVALTADGGTIGPLPDGTVIEVAPTTYQELCDALRGDYAQNARLSDNAVIDAYNARENA